MLTLKNIRKSFSGVEVLKSINLEIKEGETHAIAGENGAGKSTLVNIIMGILQPDNGEIYIEDERINIKKPKDALDLKFRKIHQEVSLCPNLSIAENIFLDSFSNKIGLKFIRWEELFRKADELLNTVGLSLDPRTQVRLLGVGQQQMVQTVKAIASKARLIIMDEPTASLSELETIKLFEIIKNFKKNEKNTVIYISHRLEEIFNIADRVTVLRDGNLIRTCSVKDVTLDELVSLMVGRELDSLFVKKYSKVERDIPYFEVKNFTKKGLFKDINFKSYKNEILGLYGLVGAGRSETALSIFGYLSHEKGSIYLEGKKIRNRSPRDLIKNGIIYVSEDRKLLSIFKNMNIKDNITIANLKKYSDLVFPIKSKEIEETKSFIKKLDIRTNSYYQMIKNLSGGNQQKIVISRLLTFNTKVIIFDEPTRGVDVGAKSEIHRIITSLADAGNCIIVISSELLEIIGISDRITVFRQGQISGDFLNEDRNIDQEILLKNAYPKKN